MPPDPLPKTVIQFWFEHRTGACFVYDDHAWVSWAGMGFDLRCAKPDLVAAINAARVPA